MARNRFFLVISTLFLAVVLIGFSRSFYLKSYFDFPQLPAHLYVHGIALTAWFSLACAQPWLIGIKKVELHRRIGVAGIAVAISVVLTGLWTLIVRDAPEIGQNPSRAAGNIASLLMFLLCVVFGIAFRRNRGMHKRLMLMASIPILAPALDRFARIPVMNEFWGKMLYWIPAPPEVAFAILGFLLLLLLVVVNDIISERHVHRGTLVGLLSVLVLAPLLTYLIISFGLWVRLVVWVT